MRKRIDRSYREVIPCLLVLLSNRCTAFLPSLHNVPLSSKALTRPTVTSVILFSTDQDEESKQSEEKNDDLQLDAWIRGIGQQWPLRPESSATQPRVDSESENPLAALLNLEALLSLTRIEPETQKSIDKLIDNISTVLKDSSPQLNQWDRWISRTDLEDKGSASITTTTSSSSSSSDNSRFLRQATSQLESILIDASALVSPSNIQGLIAQASNLVALGSNVTRNSVADLAKRITEERGFEVTTKELNDATDLAANILSVADALRLRQDPSPAKANESPTSITKAKSGERSSPRARALFSDFLTASEMAVFSPVVAKAAEIGALAGAIYEEEVELVHSLNHTIVAKGMTDDVRWMVTDALETMQSFDETTAPSNEPVLVRTITIRGFDASDEQVDRERLLNNICSAAPESIKPIKGVVFHSGLLQIARSIYTQVEPFIDWTAPSHKLVINGHSVGGSIASLILVLLTADRGLEFVMDKVLRVYTFGSPPVMALAASKGKSPKKLGRLTGNFPDCEVLEAIGFPSEMIYGFVQPWDPVVRLFSEIDALYPLIGDLGEDGVTPYATGPPRSLRPITKRIIEAWEGWPKFRENYRSTGSQRYRSAGVQHILLAEPVRYVADRFFPVNIAVPPIEAFLRISSSELLPALNVVFPLDVFEISFVPQAIRSFVHHFYPAYGSPMMDYVAQLKRKLRPTQKEAFSNDGIADDDDDEPCTVYVLEQANGTSVVVDRNKWALANE